MGCIAQKGSGNCKSSHVFVKLRFERKKKEMRIIKERRQNENIQKENIERA